jgi:hypothetical protein
LLLALLGFGSQDMAEESLVALYLSRSCLLKALGCAFVRFQFRHNNSVLGSQMSVLSATGQRFERNSHMLQRPQQGDFPES